MKKTILAALVISASIGSQVLSAATATVQGTAKVGVLTFALTDLYQYPVTFDGVATTNSVEILLDCANLTGTHTMAFGTRSDGVQVNPVAINNMRILKAIGRALNHTFSTRAQLAIVNYDNSLPAPPYPAYLVYPPGVTRNGPRSYFDGAVLGDMGIWPNELQIDWVIYDESSPEFAWDNNVPSEVIRFGDANYDCDEYNVNDDTIMYPDTDLSPGGELSDNLWPKSEVFIFDPAAAAPWTCVEVSTFFSFEEAYCYFCWDTVDRVTSGTLKTSTATDICISGAGCALVGSGTTRFYLTIKFNNDRGLNPWLDLDTDNIPNSQLVQVTIRDRLWFTVGGVVVYPWVIKNMNNFATPFGTMTMASAQGYGENPWCGVITGSVKIVETGNKTIDTSCVDFDLPGQNVPGPAGFPNINGRSAPAYNDWAEGDGTSEEASGSK